VGAPNFDSPDGRQRSLENAAMPYSASQDVTGATNAVDSVRERLMAIDGVQGVGATRDGIGNDALVVYVRDQEVAAKVPRELDGLSVHIEVTGQIDALPVRPR